ncbi:MAG: hypothetical protein AAFO58_11650, partial [Pseudomonadota bacterium]
IQNNLGLTLQIQGMRAEGARGADLIMQAATAFNAALQVYRRAEYPVDWARTQNNIANTLRIQGGRTNGKKGADFLAQAVTAYRAALEVRTRADHPVDWAITQENMGFAEMAIAQHDSCTDTRAAFARALEAVENALKIFDPIHTSYDHDAATRLRDDILAQRDALD